MTIQNSEKKLSSRSNVDAVHFFNNLIEFCSEQERFQRDHWFQNATKIFIQNCYGIKQPKWDCERWEFVPQSIRKRLKKLEIINWHPIWNKIGFPTFDIAQQKLLGCQQLHLNQVIYMNKFFARLTGSDLEEETHFDVTNYSG